MAFLLELLLTFFLLFVVSAATDSQKALKDMTPLAIGLCIYCTHMVGIPLTGTSINPTRTFASAVASYGVAGCENVWDYHWIFWLAPLMGGALATYVYQFAFASAWGESLVSQYRDDEYADGQYDSQGAAVDGSLELGQQQGVEYYDDGAQQVQGDAVQGDGVQAHSFDEQQYYDDQAYGQPTPQGQQR